MIFMMMNKDEILVNDGRSIVNHAGIVPFGLYIGGLMTSTK